MNVSEEEGIKKCTGDESVYLCDSGRADDETHKKFSYYPLVPAFGDSLGDLLLG